eukprot:1170212-Lingulodinium_polyedra.AAC.1
MVNFNARNDDDAAWHTDEWNGGSDDHAWDERSWSETWHANLWLVGDAETLPTTNSEQLRGFATVDTG